MDAALAEALAPVLRDLESSGSVIPEVGDDQWAGIDGQLTGWLRSPDGSGQGVSAMAAESPAQRIASVADQAQDGQPVGRGKRHGRSHEPIRARRSSGTMLLGMTACTAFGGIQV